MKCKELVEQLLEQGNGLFMAQTAAAAGLCRGHLSALVKEGLLERPERGVYVRPGNLVDEPYTFQRRARKIVYSHESALFFHRMAERALLRYSITVPSSYKPSNALKEVCKIYYIKQDLADLGKMEMPSGMGHMIIIYDVERTICDIVRSRNKIDSQIFTGALKSYARRRDKNLRRLFQYAGIFGIARLVRQYMELLL